MLYTKNKKEVMARLHRSRRWKRMSMSEHEHTWEIDKSRKHKRPPRVFVRCSCGASGQSTVRYGAFTAPFHINEPMVLLSVKVTKEQYDRAVESGNKSLFVRRAIQNEVRRLYCAV